MAAHTPATSAAEPRLLIIGAGMSGIVSAIKLREAGLDNFAIYEKADRLGGTWRENGDEPAATRRLRREVNAALSAAAGKQAGGTRAWFTG